MKKLLSITTALCIAITSLFTGLTAFADTVSPTKSEINTKITAAAAYLDADGSTYTYENSADFLKYVVNSGRDTSAYKDAFVQSVKDCLDENNAKLITSSGVESPAVYGATVLALSALGYDVTSFEGYNLASSFANVDIENNSDNPYQYYLTLLGAEKAGLSSDFINSICDSFVNTYYTTGSGMDYYGYACDNTAMFVITLAPYYSTYQTVIDDALAVIETYKATGGYFSDTEYITTVNTDSTALALAAYASVGNTTKALEIYSELIAFETSTEGVFSYDSDGEENSYATGDALFALETLLAALPDCYEGHSYTSVVTDPTCTEDGYTTYTCTVCGDTYTSDTVAATGHNFGTNNDAAKCSVCGTANPDYTIPTVTGLAVKSRTTTSIKLTWDAVSDAESYIVYKYNTTTKKYKKLATVSSDEVTYKVSDLVPGTVYRFKIAVKVNGTTGTKSSVLKAATKSKKVTFRSVKSSSKKKITVKWNARNCTGYQIQWSTTKDFSSNYKSVSVSKNKGTSTTITTAQSKKKYYVRVRAYTKTNGVKVYGAWSTVKTVTTK